MSTVFKCARRDDIESLESLVNSGNDVNSTTFNGETPLHIASAKNSTKVIDFLLKNNANVNAYTTITKETPLFYAVQEGHSSIVSLLLENGADINAENAEGETPLFAAMRYNRINIMNTLIQKGADVNHKNKEGKGPLSYAVLLDSTTMLHALIDANASDDSVNAQELENLKGKPLSSREEFSEGDGVPSAIVKSPINSEQGSARASYGRNYEEQAAKLFQLCIEDNAEKLSESVGNFDINNAYFDGETLLHCAVENSALNCIKFLVEKGANVNAVTNTFNEPPLHMAIVNNNFGAVDILCTAGADIEIQNAEGETALFVAIRNGSTEVVKFLISRTANVNCLNMDGITPLQAAIQLHQENIGKLLIEAGAAPSLGRFNSYSLAKENGEFDICEAIRDNDPTLARQANASNDNDKEDPPAVIFDLINRKNMKELRKLATNQYNMDTVLEGGVPLLRAIETGSLDVVKIIVNSGADVNFYKSELPLSCACRLGYLDIVDYLLKQGASPELLNDDRENVLFAAVRSGNPTIVQEIINQDVPINECNVSGMSPLYIAVAMKVESVVKVLLSHGADPNSNGHSPLKLAQDLKLTKIINLLVNSGAKSQIRRPARKTRQQVGILSLTQPVRIVTPNVSKQGKCYMCGSKRNLVKLIPCGHAVVCKKCLHKFIERRTQCPLCHLGFYATSSI